MMRKGFSRGLTRASIAVLWALFIIGAVWLSSKLSFTPRPTITILTWSDLVDPAYVRAFEEKHGVSVVLRFYASNEELIAKMRSTQGRAGDLIIPSDYAVAQLIKEGLVKQLDHTRLPEYTSLNAALLNQSFDPGNQYSLPYMWDIVGIGYVEGALSEAERERGWGVVFDPPVGNVIMVNDPIEAIELAALYGRISDAPTTSEWVDAVTSILKKQRPFVEAYSNFRSDYALATRSVPVAVSTTTYARRAMRTFSHIRFFIPEEGSFMNIENLSISSATAHEAIVYELINFLTTDASMIHHSTLYTISSARTAPQDMSRYRFFKDRLTDQEKFALWIAIKS